MFARPRRTFSSTPEGLQMGIFGFWQKVAWSQEKTRLSSMVESGKWELTIQQMQQQLSYLQAITIVSGFIRLNSTWNFPFVRSISNGFVMDTVTITLSFNVIPWLGETWKLKIQLSMSALSRVCLCFLFCFMQDITKCKHFRNYLHQVNSKFQNNRKKNMVGSSHSFMLRFLSYHLMKRLCSCKKSMKLSKVRPLFECQCI